MTNEEFEDMIERNMALETFDEYPDDDTFDEDVMRHAETCKAKKEDRYCKICLEY